MGRDGFLGEFEQMPLLAAMRLEDEAYGFKLMEELARVGRSASRRTVYITLDRQENKVYISSDLASARPAREGCRRRIVGITPEGLAALRKSRAALLDLWDGLEEALDAG